MSVDSGCLHSITKFRYFVEFLEVCNIEKVQDYNSSVQEGWPIGKKIFAKQE